MLILQVREHQPVISILDNLVAFSGVGFGDFAFFFLWGKFDELVPFFRFEAYFAFPFDAA